MSRWPMVAVMALSLATACVAQLSARANDVVTTRSDIVYTRGANGPLKADVFLPPGEGPFPGVLFIHGGGWVNGDRYQMVKMIRELAAHGYVGFTIDYDVDPVHYPASFQESLRGLEYFRTHAAEFHLDPARVAVAGSSAGGELAALVALNPGAVRPPQAALIFNGVLDLEALGDRSSMVTQYLGGACTSLQAACKDASPMAHVRAGAPAFYVGHGTADETVPFTQAQGFVDALRAANVQVHFFTATDGPHTYWMKPAFFQKNIAELLNFLSLTLRASTIPAKP